MHSILATLRALMLSATLVSLAGCDGDRPSPADASVALDSSTFADAATVDSGVPGNPGDLPICPSPSPMAGSPCTAGDGCWIPGSPCYFVYGCTDGEWSPETVCPPSDAGP